MLTDEQTKFVDYSRALIPQHICVLAWVVFAIHLILTALDWIISYDSFIAVYRFKIPMVLCCLIGILFSHSKWIYPYMEVLVLMTVFCILLSAHYQSSFLDRDHFVAICAVFCCTWTAVLIPWRQYFQILTAVISIGFIAFNISNHAPATGVMFTRELFILFVGCGGSIALSYWFKLKRYSAWRNSLELARKAEILRQLAEHGNDVVFVRNADGNVSYVSPSFERYTGRSVADIIGTDFSLSEISSYQKELVSRAVELVWQGHQKRLDVEICHVDGTKYLFDICATPIFDDDGEVSNVMSIWRDVTERSEKEKNMENLALKDQLTRAFNQRHFHGVASAAVTDALSATHSLAVIYLDLDDFRKIVERHGIAVGDQVMMEVASRCNVELETKHTLGRYGGDSLLILCSNTEVDEVSILAQRILNSISERLVLVDDNLLPVTVSAGVAVLDASAHQNFYDLLDAAARALYQSKNNGRNCFTIWAPEIA